MGRLGWSTLFMTMLAANVACLGINFAGRESSASAAAQIRELNERIAAAEALNMRHELEMRRIVAGTRAMTHRLAGRTAVAAGRNASSVFAEAVPYVGVAAMLTVTALDLQDACNTMRDIESLHLSLGLEANSLDASKVCGISLPTPSEVATKARRACEKTKLCASKDPNQELPSKSAAVN